jgi:hypothetical protein
MNNKILVLIIVIIGLGIAGWYFPKSEVDPVELEFNNSGQAKAVENETDLWQFYENERAGFSLKYPYSVSMDDAKGNLSLTIESTKIDDLDYPGFDKEEILKDIQSLKDGQYGNEYDWALSVSKKVRSLESLNGQEFMVLSRFDICDTTFERKLLFYQNDLRVIVTLKEDKRNIIDNSPEYFTTNEENCQTEKIWDFNKQDQFYQDLVDNKGFFTAQEWFDTFDKIIDTIEIDGTEVSQTYSQLIQGVWTSLDDSNSVIEFKDEIKIDVYLGAEMEKNEFGFYDSLPISDISVKKNNGKYLVVETPEGVFEYEVMKLTPDSLYVIHLPRGNTLRYSR